MDTYRAVYQKLREAKTKHPAAQILWDKWNAADKPAKDDMISKYGLQGTNMYAKHWAILLEKLHSESQPTVQEWKDFYEKKKAWYEDQLASEKAENEKLRQSVQLLTKQLADEKASHDSLKSKHETYVFKWGMDRGVMEDQRSQKRGRHNNPWGHN
eukprot:1700374-Karenia_brevis.AAC.1